MHKHCRNRKIQGRVPCESQAPWSMVSIRRHSLIPCPGEGCGQAHALTLSASGRQVHKMEAHSTSQPGSTGSPRLARQLVAAAIAFFIFFDHRLKLNTALIAKTKNRKMGKTKKEKLGIYRGTPIQPLFALNPGSTIGYAV